MIRTSSLVAMAFALSVLGGCADGKTPYTPSDGGADAGNFLSKLLDGGTTTVADGGTKKPSGVTVSCDSFCNSAEISGINCTDTLACSNECKLANRDAANAGCTDERNAVLACATGHNGAVVTCSSGSIDIAGCKAEQSAYQACLGGSTTTSSGDAGSGGSCTISQQIFSTAACQSCAQQNCCPEWNACLASTDCVGILNCASACPTNDTTCSNNCSTQYPNGVSLANTALSCMQTPCGSVCK